MRSRAFPSFPRQASSGILIVEGFTEMRSLIVTVVLTVLVLIVLQGRQAVSARMERNLDLLEAERQQQLLQVRAEQIRSNQETPAAPAPEWK